MVNLKIFNEERKKVAKRMVERSMEKDLEAREDYEILVRELRGF